MKKVLVILGLLGVVLLIAAVSLGGAFVSRRHEMVAQKEAIKGAWAQVDNVIQRRADLIPNLVNTVKGYASHEQKVFDDIASARAQLGGERTPSERIAAVSEPPPTSAWELRFRAPDLDLPHWSRHAPDRLAVATNESGSWQVHAWDRGAGVRRRVTDNPIGILAGDEETTYLPTPDGTRIVWFDDPRGDETARWARVALERMLSL